MKKEKLPKHPAVPTGRRYNSVEALMRGEKMSAEVWREYRRLARQDRLIAKVTGNFGDMRRAFITVIDLISAWDEQLAPAVHGYRFSDILMCKLNLTRLRKPRKVKSLCLKKPKKKKR